MTTSELHSAVRMPGPNVTFCDLNEYITKDVLKYLDDHDSVRLERVSRLFVDILRESRLSVKTFPLIGNENKFELSWNANSHTLIPRFPNLKKVLLGRSLDLTDDQIVELATNMIENCSKLEKITSPCDLLRHFIRLTDKSSNSIRELDFCCGSTTFSVLTMVELIEKCPRLKECHLKLMRYDWDDVIGFQQLASHTTSLHTPSDISRDVKWFSKLRELSLPYGYSYPLDFVNELRLESLTVCWPKVSLKPLTKLHGLKHLELDVDKPEHVARVIRNNQDKLTELTMVFSSEDESKGWEEDIIKAIESCRLLTKLKLSVSHSTPEHYKCL